MLVKNINNPNKIPIFIPNLVPKPKPKLKLKSPYNNEGIKIENKSAYFVIRDCAMITRKYLPTLIYGRLQNPIENLKGKITVTEIVDFVDRAESNLEAKQLLCLMPTI